jgi:excisionase family DNA binding protein
MLKVSEVAVMFAVQKETVRDWLRDGTLRGIKIGKGHYWRIPLSACEALAQQRYGSNND